MTKNFSKTFIGTFQFLNNLTVTGVM